MRGHYRRSSRIGRRHHAEWFGCRRGDSRSVRCGLPRRGLCREAFALWLKHTYNGCCAGWRSSHSQQN